MSVQIIRGNALSLPLADDSVDLVVTSPPYFGLRSYQDGGEHYDGQLGSEATPAEFVDALIAATAEMVRCVKPSGSIWVNLGDRYAGGGMGGHGSGLNGPPPNGASGAYRKNRDYGIPAKSLMGIPWRYALRCIDDLGLILRAEVIWSKPNGLPESVTDRVRRSHEQWFHFTLNPRYYSAVDEIREQHQHPNVTHTGPRVGRGEVDGNAQHLRMGLSPLGKLPGSVWSIPTQPLTVPAHLGVDHFAAFPMEWPRRIITGWSPRDVCSACGEGRRPTTALTHTGTRANRSASWIAGSAQHRGDMTVDRVRAIGAVTTVTGYACACPDTTAPATPGVVIDPFGGTGTTALVADALGRHGISVDMSTDYCRLATWRTTDPGERARARQVDKPAVQIEGQADLFALLEGEGA